MGEPAFCCPRFADYRHGFLETLCGLLDGDAQGGARLAAPVVSPQCVEAGRRPLMLREPAMVESLKKEVEEGYSTVNRRICEPAEWLTATVDDTVAQP